MADTAHDPVAKVVEQLAADAIDALKQSGHYAPLVAQLADAALAALTAVA